MNPSSNAAVSRWLAPSSRYHQHLLQQCQIKLDRESGLLTIDCPKQVVDKVFENAETIEPHLELLGAQELELRAEGQLRWRLPLGKPSGVHLDFGLLNIDQSSAIGIVRMRDHRGMNCTQAIRNCSGAERQRWLGEDMSKYHIPSELKRLVEALETHQIIWGFEYRALSFQGEEIQCVVNAHLFEQRGEIYRCVETTHCLRA